MRFRLLAHRIVPIAAVIAAVRCANDFTPPSDLLPAYINMLGGDQQSGVVGQRVSDTLVVRVTDLRDRPVEGQRVLFRLIAGGGGSALIPDTAVTDADGQAKSVWVLGRISGQQAVEARVLADGPSGGLRQVFYGQAAADVPDTVFAIRGQDQQGIVGTALAESLIVVVGDQFGNPIPGQTVSWSVPTGQGTVSASTTTTGADGRSAVLRILGPTAGAQTATAIWTALPGSPVVFNHVAGASGVSALVKVFGDNQSAPAGLPLTDSIVVRAQDASGNGVAGRSVLWVVSGGGGSISAGSTTTDAQGKTFVKWTLGTVAGPNTVTAAITGLPPVTFNATGTASQPTRIQAASSQTLSGPNSTPVFPPPSVRVFDANNNGVQGVTVTFQVTAGGGTVSDGIGSGSVVTVATGATGTATLTNWVLGPTAGTNNNIVEATAAGANITGNPVTFTASASAGQPARLAFAQQPTNTGAGVVITPSVTVQVQDLGGNLVATATNPITVNFDANPGAGTLGGTRTVNAIGGVATFNDLTINQTGTGYTLAASATGLAPATSSPFNITPGPAVKLGFIVQPSNPGAGQPMTPAVQVAVQDQFGNTVPSATNLVTVAFGNNPTGATLSGDPTQNAVAGLATFPGLSVNLTGTGYTMVASATGLTAATSAPFNIGFGAAVKLAFIQQPSNAQAGAAMAPEVQVAIQDANGNTVATANDSVFLVIGNNPSGSTLTGGRVRAAAGVAHFNALVFNLAGNGYTLVTSSGTLTGATSTAFNVTSGQGVRLAFGQQPTTASAGLPITPAVTVRMLDIQGNVVTNFVGPITVALGSNPTGGVLSGTLTQNAVAGVATFNNLTINKVGTAYSLVATNQAVITAVSNDFNVIAGPPAALQWVGQPPTIIPAVAGQPISPAMTVEIVDAGGNVIPTSTLPVTMSIFTNPGGSTLTGTLTVNAVAGVATFNNVVLNKTGTGYVLRASSGTLTPGNSVAFNVRANTAARLVFGQEPTNAVAGAVITPTVTVRVEDNFGNLADINGNVSLSLANNPGGAVFPSGSNSVIPVSGIASFPNISLNKTGTGYTIRAGVTGLVPDTSVAFNITPGAANKLVFGVQPTNAVAGVAIAPAVTVRVLDVNDNLVNSTAPVTLAISTNPGSATLTGGGPIAAVGGTATFSGLSLNRSGVGYALTATSGTLATATSLNFNITHGPASALVWTVQPTNSTAGSAIVPALQVTVRDALGNTVTGFAGNITLTIGNNPGAATLSGGNPTNLSNGVADFAVVSLNRPGTGYTLIASAGGVPPNVTSAAFNVVAGSGNQLAFIVQPTRDTVGKPMTPAVQVAVQDAQGNTVTTATNAITLSLVINAEGAVLTGNLANAVAGVATFSNLRLDKATINGYNMVATAAGLVSSPNSSLFLIDRAPSTTTVTADTPDPSVVGQPYTVNFTTVATAPASGTPTGNVTVSDGVSTCVGALTAGAGSCSLTSTTVGAKTLTGTYGGDANYVHGTSVTAPHTVNAAATTTTITGDTPDPSVVGAAYSVTYTVTANAPGSGTPPGNVTVSDGTGASCVGTVAAGTCNITSTTTGVKNLVATYAATANFAGSVSAGVPHTVNAGGTVTTITAHTPNPSTIGQPITVNFTVTGGVTTPTGTVTVTDGTVTCPAATLTAGAGSCVLTPTTGGVKTLVATYSGDATHTGSVSAGVAHTVNAAATVTTITADSPDPSVTGQGYTVNFSVTGGPTTPTGNVTVVDGTGGSCGGSLVSGAGSCLLISTTAGAKTLVATYAGDATHSGSVSAGAAHTVTAASTTTTITADTPDPSTAGVAYTVNYTVAVTAPGTGTPTGNVTVSDGTGASCVGTRAAGTCQLTSTTPGAKTLVATYAGDGNFASSVSAGVAHQVNAAGTTVTITSDTPDPSVVGQAYTVNFTVAGGATTPTGTVTVSEGAQTCGPITLAAGAGSCLLTSTTAGAKTLVATYSGDATHTGGSSAGVAHQVNQAATTTTVTSDLPDPSVVGQPVVVTYSVVVNAPGAGTPTGNVTVSDGVASCIGTVAAGTCNLITTTAGAKSITATYAGDANFAADGSPGVAHTVNVASTTTTITADTPDPSTVNAAYTVTYTVAVTAPGAGTPTGNVIVSDGTGPTCIASVAAGQCNITSTSAGAKTLTATYVGDANFNTSTSAGVAHQVNTGGTVTTITSDTPDPSVVGQQVTVSFTVSGAPGTPTGSVNVSDGTISCNGNLTGGAGSCILTFTTAGARTLTASYGGDATHDASVSAGEPHAVNSAVTSTSITGDSPDPSTAGSAYAVNYSVAVQAPGTGIPTGNVTVSDGTNSCVGTVAAGTCNLTSMTAGAKTLIATYATDGNFAGSTSAGAGHQVNVGGTTTTITSDNPDPSVVGQQITVNFTVSGAPGTPTGSVTVSDGAINCNGALTAGAGSCNLTFTTAGARNLTATYGGDANHSGSTSAVQAHAVNTAATTTTITGDSPDPSQVNVAYAVTYTVVANAPGAGTPTGNVTVSDGTGASCVGTVAAGTCNLTSTTPGAKTLTATYATDGNFGGSTSAGVAHTVTAIPTTTTVASSVNPSTFGQAVNFTATVTSGAGTPTGSVQFVVDGSNFGTPVALTGGQATSANTSSLAAGNHTVSANYTATGNFANSSGSLSGGQNVNQAGTTTNVASSSDPSVFGQSVTFTATVTSGAGTPTGNVQFVVDGSNFGGPVALAGGQATSGATSILAVGDHTVVANYLGATNFATSNGSIAGGGQTVNLAATTTTITQITPPSSNVGMQIMVDFSVTANAPGGGTPTGNVTVGDGTNSCTETVAVGTCSFTPATGTPATIQVTAVYEGSASHAGSTSAPVDHTVN